MWWALVGWGCAPVAQWIRASDFESEGRGFESLRARHASSCVEARRELTLSRSIQVRYPPATMDAPPIQYARTEDGANVADWEMGFPHGLQAALSIH